MVSTLTTGGTQLRKEDINPTVTGFALQSYVFKELLMVNKTSGWTQSYYEEDASDLTGGTGAAVKGIPRLADFPTGEVTFREKMTTMEKYGMEGVISFEDRMTNNVDVMARTLLRIGRAVAKAVDDEIWAVISESQSATNINSESIAVGKEWNSDSIANRDPIQNILDAKRKIAVNNYDPENGRASLLLSPTDFANVLGNPNIRNAGQFYTSDVTRNGNVGRLLGLKVKVSNSVTADYAMVIIDKEAATWQSLMALRVETIDDPMISWKIRAGEFGVTQLTNPKAITLLDNTQK